jgi:Icc protein
VSDVDLAQISQGQSTRRSFLHSAGVAAVSMIVPSKLCGSLNRQLAPVRLGMITDLHQDIMHDGPERLGQFLTAMEEVSPDAIVQLGDFAVPAEENQPLIDTFNNAHPLALHVLGNHDADGGYTYDQTQAAWGMSERYYVRDINGLRVIVLDGNEKPRNHAGGYPAHIGSEQMEWLRDTIEQWHAPILVLSHQPLAGPWAIDNAAEVQEVLNSAADRVLLAVNGHSHIDQLVRVGNVGYLHLNSASYVWVGQGFRHQSYTPQIHAQYPRLASACPYRDALFTTLTFDPKSQSIAIEARTSTWVGPSPAERGRDKHPDLFDGEQIVPRIRARRLQRITTPA